MIPRYCRRELADLWSEESRLRLWLEVELAVCDAFADHGQMPREVAARLRTILVVRPERVAEIEAVTRHDVAAFVQSLEEICGPEDGRYLHLGLTSSDVLDTAFALQLRDAGRLLVEDLHLLGDAIRKRAVEHCWTPVIGRSHGIHAEPTTLGHVLAGWFDEVRRCIRRLEAAIEAVSVGTISGSVGNFIHVDPEIEAAVCHRLGLKPELAATQVVPRDRHAEFFCALALVASSLERFAVTVRHWQRTELLEAEEYFHPGQKGSSSMPHKRNPVLSENVTGLCRLVRGYAMPALENVALWHERDISHSSVERVSAPDATSLLDFALRRFAGVVDRLVFYPENMGRNLAQTRGLVFSQRILMALLRGGMGREQAYRIVQAISMRAWSTGAALEDEALADASLAEHLSVSQIRECFDLRHAFRNIGVVFERVFGQPAPSLELP